MSRDPVAFDVWSRCRRQDAWCKAIVKGAVAGGVGRVSDETIQFTALRDDERVEVFVTRDDCEDLRLPGLEGFFGDVEGR